jgi:hypothetical protein
VLLSEHETRAHQHDRWHCGSASFRLRGSSMTTILGATAVYLLGLALLYAGGRSE